MKLFVWERVGSMGGDYGMHIYAIAAKDEAEARELANAQLSINGWANIGANEPPKEVVKPRTLLVMDFPE